MNQIVAIVHPLFIQVPHTGFRRFPYACDSFMSNSLKKHFLFSGSYINFRSYERSVDNRKYSPRQDYDHLDNRRKRSNRSRSYDDLADSPEKRWANDINMVVLNIFRYSRITSVNIVKFRTKYFPEMQSVDKVSVDPSQTDAYSFTPEMPMFNVQNTEVSKVVHSSLTLHCLVKNIKIFVNDICFKNTCSWKSTFLNKKLIGLFYCTIIFYFSILLIYFM
jgi:hypothetical protein